MIGMRRGRKRTLKTELFSGDEKIMIHDTQILGDIRELLSREFVCYGYKKVTKHLQRSGYRINRKKVFRLMKENNLLNHRYNYRSPAKRVVESVVNVHAPNEVWEIDIKYV